MKDSVYHYYRYMEVRQIEALLGIADYGSFSEAAKVLSTVQSNISSRIAKLEHELGTALVDRLTGHLTDSGQIVAERGRRILNEMAAIASDVSELTAEIRGQVQLGMIGTAGRWIVPLILEAQKEKFPHVALRIKEGTNFAIEPQLVNGQIDLAVLAWPVISPELSEQELFTEDLVLIAPKDHPLSQGSLPLSLEAISPWPIMLPMMGTPIRKEIDDACHKTGVQLKPSIELDGLRTIASLAFDGHGLAILPATMLSMHLRDNFVGLPIAQIEKRRVVLSQRRFGFPPAPVRAINQLLVEVVRNAKTVPAGVHIPTNL
jgi:DNA-binding transcriptional LysR family regulator